MDALDLLILFGVALVLGFGWELGRILADRLFRPRFRWVVDHLEKRSRERCG